MSELVVLQRLLVISLIAGAIGFERERHGRAAGFRTHILVGIGSCLVMLTGLYLAERASVGVQVDPTRMAAQVISGIGFLGAGTILRFRASVRGLTTAASLWAVGGVGIAVGAGFLWGAGFAGLIVMVALFGLSRLERSMRRGWYQTLIVETAGTGEELARIRRLLSDYDIEIRDFDDKESDRPGHVRLEFQVKTVPEHPQEEIVRKLQGFEHTVEAHWA
jgi:putative Mg2+ transporter-C (MgtC) family protein